MFLENQRQHVMRWSGVTWKRLVRHSIASRRGGTTSVKLSQFRVKSWWRENLVGQHMGSKYWVLIKVFWVQVTETDSTLVMNRGLIGMLMVSSQTWQKSWTPLGSQHPRPTLLGTAVRQLNYVPSAFVTLLNVQMIRREKLNFVAVTSWAHPVLRPLVVGFCIASSTRTIWN